MADDEPTIQLDPQPNPHHAELPELGAFSIGLFEGHFEGNVLTFNPGLDDDAQQVDDFTDVRDLQAAVEAAGLGPQDRAAEGDEPAHFTLVDPDGNAVLVDQFFPRPT